MIIMTREIGKRENNDEKESESDKLDLKDDDKQDNEEQTKVKKQIDKSKDNVGKETEEETEAETDQSKPNDVDRETKISKSKDNENESNKDYQELDQLKKEITEEVDKPNKALTVKPKFKNNDDQENGKKENNDDQENDKKENNDEKKSESDKLELKDDDKQDKEEQTTVKKQIDQSKDKEGKETGEETVAETYQSKPNDVDRKTKINKSKDNENESNKDNQELDQLKKGITEEMDKLNKALTVKPKINNNDDQENEKLNKAENDKPQSKEKPTMQIKTAPQIKKNETFVPKGDPIEVVGKQKQTKLNSTTQKPETTKETNASNKTLPAKQTHRINCTFPNHFCNPTAADLIDKIEDEVVTSAQQCSDICRRDPDCKFFTFFNFRRSPACFALRSCNEKKPACSVPGSCVSGHRECQHKAVCTKLDMKEGGQARWMCEGVNPYTGDIPAGTPCHTSCPSWRNEAGMLITAKSTCQPDGSWSDPISFPPGPLFFPPSLNKPDSPDMACSCQPLNITYNPNLEEGTEFFCNPEISWSDIPFKLETNAQCHLLCDKMLVAITECKEGLWTGRPDLGYWCSEEREPVTTWI